MVGFLARTLDNERMEVSAVPRLAPLGVSGLASPKLLRIAPDSHLVSLIRQGRGAAFETVYDRHHRAILSFCRHMLGDAEEAEDAVQHTFLSAYNDLMASDKPIHLRAWLFTIARNRCYSMLRARREQPTGDLAEPVTEGLAVQVQRRQDLRDLVVDMRQLPEDQRAALVLAELDALSHEEIGDVLGVPREKVKALVFQARESLVASRTARETDCSEIREQLSTLRGGGLRRATIRRHLRECSGCSDYRKDIDRQRRRLALVLPAVPTIALKEAVMGGSVGGGVGVGVAGGGGLVASWALKSAAVKGVIGVIMAGVGTASTIVAMRDLPLPLPLVGGVHRPHDAATSVSPAAGWAQLSSRATAARAAAATTASAGVDSRVAMAVRGRAAASPSGPLAGTYAAAGPASHGTQSARLEMSYRVILNPMAPVVPVAVAVLPRVTPPAPVPPPPATPAQPAAAVVAATAPATAGGTPVPPTVIPLAISTPATVTTTAAQPATAPGAPTKSTTSTGHGSSATVSTTSSKTSTSKVTNVTTGVARTGTTSSGSTSSASVTTTAVGGQRGSVSGSVATTGSSSGTGSSTGSAGSSGSTSTASTGSGSKVGSGSSTGTATGSGSGSSTGTATGSGSGSTSGATSGAVGSSAAGSAGGSSAATGSGSAGGASSTSTGSTSGSGTGVGATDTVVPPASTTDSIVTTTTAVLVGDAVDVGGAPSGSSSTASAASGSAGGSGGSVDLTVGSASAGGVASGGTGQ
jgi:RNA polymerase sigma factor (sigma-70 family)